MSWRQIAQSLFLAAGIAILVLLILPGVHVPCIVVHGPLTALRAQRAVWLLNLLMWAAAFLFAGVLPPLLCDDANSGFFGPPLTVLAPARLSCAMRC
jgi:hypothetical protein